MQTQDGQIEESYSISAGLDFPSVGPQHAYLHATGRAEYESITDEEALDAFQALAKNEGIIPALESAHALAYALKLIKTQITNSFWLSIYRGVVTKIFSQWIKFLRQEGKSDG